jgi:hypothetical protein
MECEIQEENLIAGFSDNRGWGYRDQVSFEQK